VKVAGTVVVEAVECVSVVVALKNYKNGAWFPPSEKFFNFEVF